MKAKVDYSLYLCTDRGLMTSPTIEESVELAIKGGVTVVQLREKDCSSRAFYDLALRVKAITRRFNVPLIINDRVDIALAVDADGVHVGQSDLPCAAVRAMMGPDKIVGVSASSLEEALQAQRDGADYLGVGAMYATGTKDDAKIVSMDELKAIRQAVQLPMVVIGGINARTIPNFKGMGVEGIAVVSAIVAQQDVEGAARALLKLWKD
jgi:thiamine-phosphate pyrophosphorylase